MCTPWRDSVYAATPLIIIIIIINGAKTTSLPNVVWET